MIAVQRHSLRLGAKSPFLRAPHLRPQPLRTQRNSSNSNAKTPQSNDSTAKNQIPSQVARKPQHEAGTEASQTEPVDIPIQLWYHRLGPVSTFFSWFHRMQMKRPYAVQVGTTLTTYFCGDILAQDIGGEPYDGTRTLRMLTIGAIASIPGYKWYVTNRVIELSQSRL